MLPILRRGGKRGGMNAEREGEFLGGKQEFRSGFRTAGSGSDARLRGVQAKDGRAGGTNHVPVGGFGKRFLGIAAQGEAEGLTGRDRQAAAVVPSLPLFS